MKRSVSTWYEPKPMKTLYVAHVQCRNISEHQKYQTTESLQSSVTLAHRPPYSLLSPSTSAIQFYYWRSATESFFVPLSGFSVWFPRILRKFWFFFLKKGTWKPCILLFFFWCLVPRKVYKST